MDFNQFFVGVGMWATTVLAAFLAGLAYMAIRKFGRWLRWKQANRCGRCRSLRTQVSGFASYTWGGQGEYLYVSRRCRACGHRESKEGEWVNGRWVDSGWVPIDRAAA